MAALGLHCCMQALSSCRKWGLLPIAVGTLLLHSMDSRHAGFSSCGSWALECRLSSCGAQAQQLCGTWDPPRPGFETVSPALAGGLPMTAPPGKPGIVVFVWSL